MYRAHTIQVFDTAGTHLYTFGKHGRGPGQFYGPGAVLAHPNGNLLVSEHGNRRVQEVTWTGEHVRFLCDANTDGLCPEFVTMSPDGSVIAVTTGNSFSSDSVCTVELLNASTGALLRSVNVEAVAYHMSDIQISPDGRRLVTVGKRYNPQLFDLEGKCTWTPFGVSAGVHRFVEFTDGGDVVLCGHYEFYVYARKTLKLLRRWSLPQPHTGLYILGIRAHGGLLYVLCRSAFHTPRFMFMYVYE